jgi:hypothetical protein
MKGLVRERGVESILLPFLPASFSASALYLVVRFASSLLNRLDTSFANRLSGAKEATLKKLERLETAQKLILLI